MINNYAYCYYLVNVIRFTLVKKSTHEEASNVTKFFAIHLECIWMDFPDQNQKHVWSPVPATLPILWFTFFTSTCDQYVMKGVRRKGNKIRGRKNQWHHVAQNKILAMKQEKCKKETKQEEKEKYYG